MPRRQQLRDVAASSLISLPVKCPLPAFSCLLCVGPGIVLLLRVSIRLLCSYSQAFPACCFLACTFTALAMGSPCFAPRSPVPRSSFPLSRCTDSRTLMLNWPYKMMHYLATLLSPSSSFNFFAGSACWLQAASTWRRGGASC